jgi:hypothetical protein
MIMLLCNQHINTFNFFQETSKKMYLTAHKKGMSREMDLAFDDMYG